jgi:outer membrane receptor protein involved in Fe transport
MRKFGLLSTSAISSAAFFGMSLALAAPAHAQENCDTLTDADERAACLAALDTEQEIESGQPATGDQTLTVTGTRIRTPNITSNVPITSVSVEDLTSQGDPSIGDALNELPSLRSTFSQANSVRFIGTTGLNVLDLRGLGTERTLVLVNGRRHITAVPGAFLVDVNTIPSDLLERVDVITGGNSAVYGSDAVAGVVNFVMRRDFDGIRLRGQAGVSQQGDRGIQFVSLTAGRNFLDDRANIAINLEYVNAEALYFIDRPALTGAVDGRCQFNQAEPVAGEPLAGDGVPDLQFFCGVRNRGISNGGTVTAPIAAATCRNPAILQPANAALAALCLNPGTPLGVPRFANFSPGGQLLQVFPALDFLAVTGGVSGNYIHSPLDPSNPGATLRDSGQIAPGLDRYTANLLAHFDVSEAFRPFVEAKFVRLFARQEGQATFFQASFPGFFGAGRGIRCDNPFLTDQNISTLQTIGRCAGGNTSTETIPVARFNIDFGGRSELIERETWRVVAGIQGDFFDTWNYEVSFNYGRVDFETEELNDLAIFDIDAQGNIVAEGPFLQAVDAIRDPVTGQIVCRDPAARAAGCVPINLFGAGSASQAAIDYVTTTSSLTRNASQYNAVAFVNGDLSRLFELPGGPISFVLGGEWRRETAFATADPLSAAGATFFNAFPVFDPPAFEVYEAFGEIRLPLLRDLPFAHELTLSAAARYSDYNTAADKTFSYNLNGTWAPVRDLRFRANYSQAVRVPTLSDLFTPSTQSFAFVQDPCDVNFRGPQGGQRDQNCDAEGIPDDFINTIARTQTIEIAFAGNPNLLEETGKSLTLGAVFTPRWIPGFSLTVDYYRIRVEDLIASLGAQTILNQCYDLPDLNNQFCQLIARQPNFLFCDLGNCGRGGVISSGVNFARQEADGIDVEVAYRRTFDNGHRLNVRGIATYVLKRNNFISPTNPDFSDRQLSELGDPRLAANLNVTYGIGPWDLRYSLNYIHRTTIGAYESYFSHDGRPPQNADLTAEVWYPTVLYHALRLSVQVDDRFQFYGGVDNLFDTEPRFPQFGSTGVAAGDNRDYIGRYFYAGARIDF